MRSLHRVFLLAAIVSLGACGKEDSPTTGNDANLSVATQQAKTPFQHNGELLSINVENMPRSAFVAELSKLTGANITVDGDNTQTVTIHINDATLRKVLSAAFIDIPYAINMQFANLQDSFPISVSVTRYQPTAQQAATAQLPATKPQAANQPTQEEVQKMMAELDGEEPEISSMPAEEQVKYFLSKNKEDQTFIIFGMEPTAANSALMAKLITNENVSSEVKQEILSNVSMEEYSAAIEIIKLGLSEKNPDVAIKATEVLSGLGSEADVPMLKAVLEQTSNEDVRTAINDTIEALSPVQ